MTTAVTTRFQVTTFHVEHYRSLFDIIYAWTAAGRRPDPDAVAREYAAKGPAWTAWIDGEVAACGGMMLAGWPMGFAWAAVAPVGRAHPVFLHRAVKRHLEWVIADKHLRRVEATVIVGNPTNERWAKALGFQYESRKRLWGPAGEDALVLVRLDDHH